MRNVTKTIRAGVSRLWTGYKRTSKLRRLTMLTIASFLVFVTASLYAINTKDESTQSAANGQQSSDPQIETAAPEQKKVADNFATSDESPNSSSSTPSHQTDYPANRLDLTNWKIALPINTGHAGNPDEIKQPEIAAFSISPYFMNNPNGDGVVFRAHAGGATTKNSRYPRSELREMTNNGRDEARWSSRSGTHSMTVRQAVTHLPDKKPELVTAQIHDDSDDIIMVRLEKKRLFVEADGEDIGVLDENYVLGRPYTVTITAEKNAIRVYYEGTLKVTYQKDGDDYYFKAGCYTQSNQSRGDVHDAYGEVVIYDLRVRHS